MRPRGRALFGGLSANAGAFVVRWLVALWRFVRSVKTKGEAKA